jgi:TatD DNase family protein
LTALLDTHLHLYRDEFGGEASSVLARAEKAGIGGVVHVGYTFDSNRQAQEQMREPRAGSSVVAFATAGLHPHDAEDWGSEVEEQIRALADEGRIVAIGECGLDFYRDLSPRDRQVEVFRAQIRLAKQCGLPMIHHVRDAYAEARAVLEEEGLPPRRGIFHAFAGDEEFARWAVGQGYRLGIGGPLTYPKSRLAPFLGTVPLAGLQLETDAPWLPPQPWRGRRNEPAYARVTAETIARLHEVDVETVAEVQAREFEALFDVELPASFREVDLAGCAAPRPGGGDDD